MHVETTVDTSLHLLAHLLAVDGFPDLGAATGADGESKSSEQAQSDLVERAAHGDSLSWREANLARLVCDRPMSTFRSTLVVRNN